MLAATCHWKDFKTRLIQPFILRVLTEEKPGLFPNINIIYLDLNYCLVLYIISDFKSKIIRHTKKARKVPHQNIN